MDRQEFYDDDEHGAGEKLLNWMIKANIDNRAVYVTRHYDGQHIGPQRFEYIVEAAKKALTNKPFNSLMKSFQFPWNKQEMDKEITKNLHRHSLQESVETSDTDGEIEFRTACSPRKNRSWASTTTDETPVLAKT